jgi:serine/threonine protein phosphatase PrpC
MKGKKMAIQLKVSVGQYSDKGVKEENQDSLGSFIPDNLVLLETKGIASALADGISSSSEAKQASQCCITGFLSDYFSTPDSWSVKMSGQKVLTAINTWLYTQSSQFRDASRGLASTFSAVVIKSTTAHLFHVGDSRIYLLREGVLEQLTTDHRIQLPGEKEYLARAMGVDIRLDIDYKSISVEVGDTLILSTDGIHDYLSDSQIQGIVEQEGIDLDVLSEKMATEALSAGSLDNISCQLVRVDQLPIKQPDEVLAQLLELPFPPELYEGVIIDGYKITRELHASSTSQLYAAIDTETDEQVVIKTPSVNFEDDPAYLERFQLEEWVGRRIDSPNVIKIKEQTRPRRFLYYIMEYIEGQTLEQWMDDNGTFDLVQVRDIIPQAISGLRAFHRLDMLHQDLKPGNIMITNDGVVKVVDFGSTKIAGIADISTPIERSELLGTKDFTAPEYLLGQAGTTRSDMFALGCIIYQMLTGKLPYAEHLSRSSDQVSLNRLTYIPMNNLVSSVPHWVDKAIRTCVQIDPEKRYEKLSELEADLRKPNPKYLTEEQLPLIERNPLKFWKCLSGLLFLSNVMLIYVLVS